LLLPVAQDRHSPSHETEKSRTAAPPKLAFREAGMQVSSVTMSCPLPESLFDPVYKSPAEALYSYPYLNQQKPLFLPIIAYTLSTTKLEIRAK
jgi:hypothetical protein